MQPINTSGMSARGMKAILWMYGIGITFIITMIVCFESPVKEVIYSKCNCEYVLPKPYVLVRNDYKKKWAIKQNDRYGDFLAVTFDQQVSFFTAQDASYFNDSCRAKGAVEKYLKSITFK